MVTDIQERVSPTFRSRRALPTTNKAARPSDSSSHSIVAAPRRLISPLVVRLFVINFSTLLVLLGLLWLGQYRQALLDSKIESLSSQGEIVAGAIGESAVLGESLGIDPKMAEQIIGRLAVHVDTRIRLFIPEEESVGILLADSQNYGPATHQVEVRELPPPKSIRGLVGIISAYIDRSLGFFQNQKPLKSYGEYKDAISYGEVSNAFKMGESFSELRQMSDGRVVASVSIPVQPFKQIVGVLLISDFVQDIEEPVAAVKSYILLVIVIALGVNFLLFFLTALTIVSPINRLAKAAYGAEYQTGKRNVIPDLSGRKDEIGDLSTALRGMLNALYERIDSIEAFAADVAHEIKNPLASIQNAVETFSKTDDSEQQARLLEIVRDDIQRLDRIISDISNASRLDAELARADRISVDLLDVAITLAEIQNSTSENVPGLEVTKFGSGPFKVLCIEDRIGQVLRNLLANAESFSPDDSKITIELRRFSNLVEITVEDDGPGIEEDKLEKVFERFHSQRPGDEPFGNHSGLGLSISRQIIEAHGGSIHAENRIGPHNTVLGARFVVALPAA